MRRDLPICLLLVLSVAAVYWPVAGHEFLNYDDPAYVSENAVLENGASWKAVAWSFTTFEGANWHPVTWLSHMLDCQMFDRRPAAHHMVNVLLHAANTVLLFLVLRRMTAAPWRSAAVAALFALHPLHVESVAWVAERKDVLSTFFGLLAMAAYVRYVRLPICNLQRPRERGARIVNLQSSYLWYAATFVLLALSLMSKPMLVTLPFLLLLLDYWPLRRFADWRSARWLLIEKLPLLALSVASSVVTFVAQRSLGAMSVLGEEVSLPARLANALVTYVAYLGKTFWPRALAPFYPYVMDRPLWQPLAAAAVLVVVTAAGVWQMRKRPYLAVGWFWYLGMLVPVIGLVQVGGQAMADRYTYIPLVGIFIATVWAVADCLAGYAAKPQAATGFVVHASTGRARKHGLKAALQNEALQTVLSAGVPLAIVAACAIVTAQRLRYWVNTETLFKHALLVTDDNVVAHENLGDIFLQQKRNAEAAEHYAEIVRIAPRRRAMAHCNWAQALANEGQVGEAVAHWREALELNPDLAIAHNNLAQALKSHGGRPQEVIAHLRAAVRLAPEKPEGLNNLASALATCPDGRFRDGAEAVRAAEQACTLTRNENPAYLETLVLAYAEAGRRADAAATARRAAALAREAGQTAKAAELESRAASYASP